MKQHALITAGVVRNVNANAVYQFRRTYVRANKHLLCPTLTANMGTGGNNVPFIRTDRGVRRLTPRECFNLQGFPPSYAFPSALSDSTLYKLAGNAVSVPVVKKIAERLIPLLSPQPV
jgi:DNA (cytosine-5)-methyltransferase 1